MKAVILAAGLGTRLRPITDNMPKCMIPVNGESIIDKQIDNLLINGIKMDDILVITGYKRDILEEYLNMKYPQIKIIPNYRYAETNNMYSLYLVKEDVYDCDFLLMNADVFYDANIITGLLNKTTENAIACDRTGYMEESMKITLDGCRINHISKKISECDYYAVSIDVYKLSKEAGRVLFDEVEDIIVKRQIENSWTEVALDNIFNKVMFQPYIIEGRWFEIDNHEDLKKAELIFSK